MHRKRRSPDSGSVFPDHRNARRFRAQIWIDGVRIGKSGFRTQKEARAWIRQTVADAEAGIAVTSDRKTTVVEYLARWWETLVQPNLRPSTAEGYERAIRLHLAPVLGTVKLGELRPEQIQRAYARLLASGRGKRAIQLAHVTLHAALEQAVRWRVLGWNPAAGVRPPQAETRQATPWTIAQARDFIAAVEGTSWEPLYLLLLLCGLRRGEVAGLHWSDVDMVERALLVQRGVVRITGQGGVEGPQKTQSSVRILPLPEIVVEALRAHRKRQGKERLSELVFPGRDDGPMDPHTINQHFTRTLERLGLPHVWPHVLRHTFNSLLAHRRVSPSKRAKLMGHASPHLTIGVYEHVVDGDERAAADELDALWKASVDAKHARSTRETEKASADDR